MATGAEQEDFVAGVRASVARVHATIAAACRKSGRDAGSVQLVAVTKYADLPALRAVLAAGVTDLAESRVQQLVERARQIDAALPSSASLPTWHMIGHLQRNKVRAMLGCCRILHSLDSLRLAQELETAAAASQSRVAVYMEVNVAGEQSKTGVAPAEAVGLVEAVAKMPHIDLRGLMTMAPFSDDPEFARPHFAHLRELLESLRWRGIVDASCNGLSMGMSQDYAVAVEEGATVVRVGSALLPNPLRQGAGLGREA